MIQVDIVKEGPLEGEVELSALLGIPHDDPRSFISVSPELIAPITPSAPPPPAPQSFKGCDELG